MESSIQKIEVCTTVIPLTHPARIARRGLPERHYTVVKVFDSDMNSGVGFCYAGGIAATFVVGHLAPIYIGQPVDHVERLWDESYSEMLLLGRRGAGIRALSALDIAVWDLRCKRAGKSLSEYLGIFQSPVPAYASGGYYVAGRGNQELANEVSAYADAGYTAVKIKVGGVPIADDVARVRLVRETLGDSIRLMLDANNAWRDVNDALYAIRRFEEFDIEWIEEPLSPDDVDGHRQLADVLDMKVATGEIEATRWGFRPLIETRAADVLQPDATVAGGITEWVRIAAAAAMYNIPIAPHWFADLHVHCVAATPNATWIEHFTDTKILNVMEMFDSALVVNNGFAVLPKTPGHGIVLNDAQVAEWATGPWQIIEVAS